MFKGPMLLSSMFVRPKMGYVRGKIGLTGQFDLRQPGNYLQPCYLVKLNDNGSYHGLRELIRKLENHYPELKIY